MGDAARVAGAGVGGWEAARREGVTGLGAGDGCRGVWAGLGMPGETVASVGEAARLVCDELP